MRYLVFLLSVLAAYILGGMLGAEHAKAETVHCNQKVFDETYKLATQKVISGAISKIERTSLIDFLRSLCNGQKSTYETRNSLNGVGGSTFLTTERVKAYESIK